MGYDIDQVRSAAATRWPEIISHLTGVDQAILDGQHHPCPICGGTDRFRFFRDGSGGAICNQCLTSKNGDGFAVLQWLTNDDFSQVLSRVAEHLGIEPSKNGRGRKAKSDPAEHLVFKPWNDILMQLWCDGRPPITPAAVEAFGGRLATYRRQYQVIAFPIHGAQLAKEDPVGWIIYPLNNGTLPKFIKDKSPEWVKVKVTYGSDSGIVGPVDQLAEAKTIWKLEGTTDALAVQSILPAGPRQVAITNSNGAKERPQKWIIDLAAEKTVYVLHDADRPGQDGAMYVGDQDGKQRPGWAPSFATAAAECRNVVLPYPIVPDHGRDVRNWLQEGHVFADLEILAGQAEPLVVDQDSTSQVTAIEADDDPHRLARVNLHRYATRFDGATIRNWRDEWYTWKANRYRKIPHGEIAAKLNLSVKEEFDRLNIEEQQTSEKVTTTKKVTKTLVSNVLEATKGMTVMSGHLELGTWIDELASIRERRNYIAMQNGILDMDALLAGSDDIIVPHSPRWFSTTCLPYKFDLEASCPKWLAFLDHNLEADQERISLLQEWAGYMLLPDTGQQRFLVLEGEGANGKSVYLAALEAMLGEDNCSHVPLELFGDRFSRTQSLGKLANIAPDVGELDKPAEGHLKSFTGGEKMFFDRKGISGLEAYPTARLMIACNNRPRFSDKSDGIWRRMILVPLRVRIGASERIRNMDKPWWWEQSGELPGMLNWAIAGLDRLRRNGSFTEPKICLEAAEDYRTENNPARQFLNDRMAIQNGVEVQCTEVYDSYKRWCTDNGFHALSSRSFGKEVARLSPSGSMIDRRQRRICGIRHWFYVGLTFDTGGGNDGDNGDTFF